MPHLHKLKMDFFLALILKNIFHSAENWRLLSSMSTHPRKKSKKKGCFSPSFIISRFSLFNSRPHTVLHCHCDQNFRSCLRLEGSEKSALVGRFFFNQLRSPCFVFDPSGEEVVRCMERNWWGNCIREERERKARWREPVPY